MICKGLFQPRPFCDSMISSHHSCTEREESIQVKSRGADWPVCITHRHRTGTKYTNSLILRSIIKQDFPVVFSAVTATLKDTISWLDRSHTGICKCGGLRGWKGQTFH